MRILLSDTGGSGGVSTFVAQLGSALVGRGHDVEVIVGYPSSPSLRQYNAGVNEVHTSAIDFTGLVLEKNYDIVHVTDGDLGPPFDYVRRIRRMHLPTRTVATVHKSNALLRSTADVVCFVSQHSYDSASIPPGTATRIIPNGVEVPASASVEASLVNMADGPVAIWIGRIEETARQKDYFRFACAIKSLLDSGMQVVVVDGSPELPEYSARAQLCRWFGPSVHYFNQAPHEAVLGTLAVAAKTGGALVSTSRTEAPPFTALEAASVGCRVVVPNIPAFEDLIERSIADPYDSLEGLIRTTTDLSSAGPRALPPDWSLNTMADRYIEVYVTLLSQHQVEKGLNRTAAHLAGSARNKARLLSRMRKGG